jgi:hypothetical protein
LREARPARQHMAAAAVRAGRRAAAAAGHKSAPCHLHCAVRRSGRPRRSGTSHIRPTRRGPAAKRPLISLHRRRLGVSPQSEFKGHEGSARHRGAAASSTPLDTCAVPLHLTVGVRSAPTFDRPAAAQSPRQDTPTGLACQALKQVRKAAGCPTRPDFRQCAGRAAECQSGRAAGWAGEWKRRSVSGTGREISCRTLRLTLRRRP